MAEIKIRRAFEKDKDRILEISSKIWEGDDYIPFVLEEWLKNIDSEFIVAEFEGQIAGFARYARYSENFGWLEGIRTDPGFQNLGIGKVITDYFINMAQKEGVKKLALSTYIDNRASIHIIESKGFVKTASFMYFEHEIEQGDLNPNENFSYIEKICPEEAFEFIENSQFLNLSKGLIPAGWKFYPFELVKGKFKDKIEHVSGIRKEGKINSLACFSKSPESDNDILLLFLDGQIEEMKRLLRYVLANGKEHSFIVATIPGFHDKKVKALEVLKSYNFRTWNNFNEDTFLYIKEL